MRGSPRYPEQPLPFPVLLWHPSSSCFVAYTTRCTAPRSVSDRALRPSLVFQHLRASSQPKDPDVVQRVLANRTRWTSCPGTNGGRCCGCCATATQWCKSGASSGRSGGQCRTSSTSRTSMHA
eukprot:3052349-Rhodomonas_salina.2